MSQHPSRGGVCGGDVFIVAVIKVVATAVVVFDGVALGASTICGDGRAANQTKTTTTTTTNLWQYLEAHPKLRHFTRSLASSRLAMLHLRYRNVAVFAPLDDASRDFAPTATAFFNEHLLLYHMSFQTQFRTVCNGTIAVPSALPNSLPLWIHRSTDRYEDAGPPGHRHRRRRSHHRQLFVNSAKVLETWSCRTRHCNRQALYVLDTVLNPGPASDLTATEARFPLVWQQALHRKWASSSGFTGECVHNMQNGTFVVVLPSQQQQQQHHHQHQSGNSSDRPLLRCSNLVVFSRLGVSLIDHEKRFGAVVLQADIPLWNGVLHVMRRARPPFLPASHGSHSLQPVADNFSRFHHPPQPRYFPRTSIRYKACADPMLSIGCELLSSCGWLDQNNEDGTSASSSSSSSSGMFWTYFAIRDRAWYPFLPYLNLRRREEVAHIMGQHLVWATQAWSMARMRALAARQPDGQTVLLNGASGPVVFRLRHEHTRSGPLEVIEWHNRTISIVRSDYVCSDGVVHVIGRPFIEWDEDEDDDDDDDDQPDSKSFEVLQRAEKMGDHSGAAAAVYDARPTTSTGSAFWTVFKQIVVALF